MNTPGKDYTHHSWLAAAALIAVLVAVSFIPPQSVGGVKSPHGDAPPVEPVEPVVLPPLYPPVEPPVQPPAVPPDYPPV